MDVVTSNPLGGDIDGDGLTNQQEVYTYGTNQFHSDTDGDGINDLYEVNNTALDPLFEGDALLDPDGDNLVNDKWEIVWGFNPLIFVMVVGVIENPNTDPDGDGLTNQEESEYGTDPNNDDTDDDGVNDSDEIDQGSNPLDSDDDSPPPDGTTPMNIRFGDPASSSGSEKYKLFLYPLEGDPNGPPRRLRTNQQYGVSRNVTFNLPKGSKYKVVLEHHRTIHPSGDPDFDYEIELLSLCATLEEDQGGMAGNHFHSGFTGSFHAAGKSCTLYVPLFEWITPKESPVTMPNDGLPAGTPGQNEFPYDLASPGVLTIGLEMLVKPAGTAQSVNYDTTKFSDRCFFVTIQVLKKV